MTFRSLSLCLLAALCGLCLSAQAATLSPGTYTIDGGWGTLELKAQGQDLAFQIDTQGANGHSCGVDGVLKGQSLSLQLPDGRCEIRFQPGRQGVKVSSNQADACRLYCGARASFEGEFRTTPPGCTLAQQTARRKRFRVLYDSMLYADALTQIQSLLSDCSAQLGSPLLDWVRNDMAVTQYKLGQRAACLATLKTVTVFGQSDDAIRDNYPPTDAENFIGVARATRTNVKLCSSTRP